MTLPSTKKGTAKVQIGRGIKVNGFWYTAKDGSFNQQAVEGTQVPVRYKPFDLGEAFAFVKSLWVPCISEHYSILRGRTEKELQIYSAEKRQERRKYGRELSDIAKGNALRFLSSDRPTEKQALQRQRDLSALDVQQQIDGNYLFLASSQLANAKSQIGGSCDDVNSSSPESVNEVFSKTDIASIRPYEDDTLWQM